MSRPRADRNTVVTIRTAITLRRGQDDDLIAFFAALPRRKIAPAIRAALRAGGLSAGAQTGCAPADTTAVARDLDEALDNLL